MIEVVTESQFIDRFRKIRPTNFTYEGLQALFEYLEQYEDDTGEEIELDVIGLCCEFYQYDNLKEFQDDYGKDYECIEDIENETMVVLVDEESFIIRQF
mgnify:FL=1|tara:strand:+ start:3094 stop:3390 length:297 start_codon:yes stop_codon:yes gene_type:complete